MTFCEELNQGLSELGIEPIRAGDIADEIHDMISPAVSNHITLKDLESCGVGGTIVGMLIDVEAFWRYDKRESLMQHPE